MTIDEVIELLNGGLPKGLTPLQELVLRSAWQGKTYAQMAHETNYVKEYISRIAAELWPSLSDFWGEAINKVNFRHTLESRRLTKAQRQCLEEFRRSAAPSLEFPSGPVSPDSKLYIERPPVEELGCEEVTKPGSIIRIKAPWKMGKTSLMLRILAYAQAQGYRTATIDFQQAEEAVFANVDKFFRWFGAIVSRELQLESRLDDYWDEDIGSKVSCNIYFQEYLLARTDSPVVLAFNEGDRLFEYPEIAKEFFSLLRSWHERSKQVKIWQNLRLIVTYSTEIQVPIQLNQSPFNVGLPLNLPPLTPEQVLTLAHRHKLDWTNTQTKQIMEMVGGHPFLLRLAFYYLYRGKVTLKELLQQALTESGIYSDRLRYLLTLLQAEPSLEAAFKQVISVPPQAQDRGDGLVKLEALLAYKLESMGLVTIDGDRTLPSCELYRLYFRKKLIGSGSG